MWFGKEIIRRNKVLIYQKLIDHILNEVKITCGYCEEYSISKSLKYSSWFEHMKPQQAVSYLSLVRYM